MSEWQPAILKRAGIHSDAAEGYDTKYVATKARVGMRVRVRPYAGWPFKFYCTEPNEFFEVHPDDAEKLMGVEGRDGEPFVICEHQFITD